MGQRVQISQLSLFHSAALLQRLEILFDAPPRSIPIYDLEHLLGIVDGLAGVEQPLDTFFISGWLWLPNANHVELQRPFGEAPWVLRNFDR